MSSSGSVVSIDLTKYWQCRDVPGKGIAWIRPDCMASMVAAPWFPRPGDTGHYFGKFSGMLLGIQDSDLKECCMLMLNIKRSVQEVRNDVFVICIFLGIYSGLFCIRC